MFPLFCFPRFSFSGFALSLRLIAFVEQEKPFLISLGRAVSKRKGKATLITIIMMFLSFPLLRSSPRLSFGSRSVGRGLLPERSTSAYSLCSSFNLAQSLLFKKVIGSEAGPRFVKTPPIKEALRPIICCCTLLLPDPFCYAARRLLP